VLVVDDEEELRQLAAGLLDEFGFAALTAPGGEEALRMLEGDFLRIDLLFTDVMMPGKVNGFTLAKKARAMRPDLRIVLTSGYIDPDLADAMSREFYPILAKPYRAKQLLGMIGEQFQKQPLLAAEDEDEPGNGSGASPSSRRDDGDPPRHASGRH
jgi:DNA-binding NtrC family response regulator